MNISIYIYISSLIYLFKMWFFNKKKVEIVEKTFPERLARLESRITTLEAENLELMTSINVIRNKVLRKIQFKKEEEEEKKEETQNLYSNNPIFL